LRVGATKRDDARIDPGGGHMEQVSFTQMQDGTAEDWALLDRFEGEFNAGLPDRILGAVDKLDGSYGGYLVSRYTHSLQAATRAMRDGKDEEYLVATLVHDIGDDLAPFTHGEMVASVLKPFVREELCWMVQRHPVFQLHYFSYLSEEERNGRDRWRDHPHYALTAEFCEQYDQASFDPDYPTEPIDVFDPMVRRVFAEPRYLPPGWV
jgi:predicted HD phosphohydrolase